MSRVKKIVNTTAISIYDAILDGKMEAITTLIIINNVEHHQIVKLIEAVSMQGSRFLCAAMCISWRVSRVKSRPILLFLEIYVPFCFKSFLLHQSCQFPRCLLIRSII